MNERIPFAMTDSALLDAALVDYFARVDRGESFELTEIIAAHPGCEDGLRQFLKQERKLHVAAATSLHAAANENLGGRTLGDFRLVRELGRGGMGVVYEAEQLSLGRRIALKVLPFAAMLDKQQLARFKNEARAAATLDHANIVAVYSVGCEGSVHYYAMQLVEGRSLAQVIASMRRSKGDASPLAGNAREDAIRSTAAAQGTTDFSQPASDSALGRSRLGFDEPSRPSASASVLDTHAQAQDSMLPELHSREFNRTVARLGIQAAQALDHAHQNGILHRDIKPANLLIDAKLKLWIADFGLARIEADAGMTMTGDIIGTLRYMAPEQALAKRIMVDHRADIYSLGATLYELLTLRPPFEETDRSELLKQIAFKDPRSPRQLDRQIPVELETIVLKAMRKGPEHRYGTAHELADDLQSFLECKPIKAKPPAWRELAVKWSRRHPAAIWTAVLILLATTLVSTVSAVLIDKAYKGEAFQRKLAEAEHQRADVEKNRAEQSFHRARVAMRRLLDDAAKGRGEWSELTPSLRKKFTQEAFAFYQAWLETKSGDPSLRHDAAVAYRSIAAIHYSNKEFEQAEKLLNQSVEILERLCTEFPDDTAYNYQLAYSSNMLGQTLLELKRPVESDAARVKALSLYKMVIAKRPDELAYIQEVSDIATGLRNLRKSQNEPAESCMDDLIAICQDAAARAPDKALIRVYLGDALYQEGRIEQAYEAFQEALRLDPKINGVHRRLAEILLYKRGQFDESIREYREEIRLHPDYTAWHSHLGFALANHGRCDEAVAEFREAIRLKPMCAGYHGNLSEALYNNGRLDEAISECREAIRLQPDEGSYHGQLGEALYEKGLLDEATNQYQEAIAAWRKSIQRKPNDSFAPNSLAWLLATCSNVNLRNPHKAVELAKKAVELSPNANRWNTLGVAHYRAGNYGAAVEALTKSCEFHGDEPTNYFFLAMAEWQLGNHDSARTWYDKAVAWLKQHPQITAGELYVLRDETDKLVAAPKPVAADAGRNSERSKAASFMSDHRAQ